MAEIERLHHELDRANESVDDKLDRLEDAGLGVVELTRKLDDARSRIISLEDEIARLSRKEDRRAHRLERLRCQKCLTKVRFSDADERYAFFATALKFLLSACVALSTFHALLWLPSLRRHRRGPPKR